MATAKHKKKKKQKASHGIAFYMVITLLILLALAAAALAGIYHWLSPYRDYPYIFPNVSFDGISLEGLTREEAERAITNNLSKRDYALTVAFPDGQQYTLDPMQEVHIDSVSAVVDQAYQYGRMNTQPMAMYNAIRAARGASYEIPAQLTILYDKDDLRQQIDQMITSLTIQPGSADGSVDENAKTVTITPGQPGRTADADQIFDAACNAYDTAQIATIQAQYMDIPLNTEQVNALVAALEKQFHIDVTETSVSLDEVAHTAKVTKGTPGYSIDVQALMDNVVAQTASGNYEPYTMPMTETLPTDVDLSLLFAGLETDPTPVEYHDGELTGGQPGYEIDAEDVASQVKSLTWGQSVTLEMTEVPPEHTIEEVQEVLFRDELGSCHTSHTSDSNRTTNLRLACQEIDGIILNSGATFSFNTFVGERTAEKGYRKAIVYVDGEEESDDGGGVCQVVSTLYDAALYADLEITDRIEHRFVVSYVPGGLDATVYWGIQDFCFVNTTDYPIQIHASVSGGQVHVSIDGTNDSGQSVRLESSQVSSDSETVSYEAFQLIYDSYGDLIERRSLGISTYDKHK